MQEKNVSNLKKPLKFKYVSNIQHMNIWEPGKKERWYDNYVTYELISKEGAVSGVFALADAQSQHKISSAGRASQMAVNSCKEALSKISKVSQENMEKEIRNLFWNINRKIHELENDEGMQLFAYLGAIFFVNNKIYVGNVGNGRIFRFKNGSLDLLSNSSKAEESGLSDNMAVKGALGDPDMPYMDFCAVDANPGEIYILCTDGFYNLISEGTIKEILSRENYISQKCEVLMDKVKMQDMKDDASLILVEFDIDRERNKIIAKKSIQGHLKDERDLRSSPISAATQNYVKSTLWIIIGIVFLVFIFLGGRILLKGRGQVLSTPTKKPTNIVVLKSKYLIINSNVMLKEATFNNETVQRVINKENISTSINLENKSSKFEVLPEGNYKLEITVDRSVEVEFGTSQQNLVQLNQNRLKILLSPSAAANIRNIPDNKGVILTISGVEGRSSLELITPESVSISILKAN